MKLFDSKRKILIKTYTFESGLWYLSQTLYKQLLAEGHEVHFISKSKYSAMANMYERSYPEPHNKAEFENKPIIRFSSDKSILSQILNAVTKYDIDTIISFETLMEKSSWISSLKNKKNINIIDIPMIEWVSPKFLSGKSYSVFDEIWCLNDLCFDHFKIYKSSKKISWDFADSQLFNTIPVTQHNQFSEVLSKSDGVKFLHFGSLNPEYSSKNTDEVIKAFLEFSNDQNINSKLLIVGKKTEQNKKLLEKNSTILFTESVMDYKDIAVLYKSADALIMPSVKEGLGLSLFQASACGLKIITTDAKPMNESNNNYLCKVDKIKADGTLVPRTESYKDSILEQIKKCYEDIKCL